MPAGRQSTNTPIKLKVPTRGRCVVLVLTHKTKLLPNKKAQKDKAFSASNAHQEKTIGQTIAFFETFLVRH